jgi:hypothetical protein
MRDAGCRMLDANTITTQHPTTDNQQATKGFTDGSTSFKDYIKKFKFLLWQFQSPA